MALTKPAKTFEDDSNDTAVLDAPTTAAKPAAASSANVPATVKPAGGSVSTNVKKFVSLTSNFKDAIPAMGMGALPTLKVKAGAILDDLGANLGDSMTIDLKSYNIRWVASPSEEGNEAAKLLRTSYDGVRLVDGRLVDEYIAHLKTKGYEDAKVTRRIDVIGILLKTAKEYNRVGDLVMIDLAPTSCGKFEGQLLQASVKLSQGVITEDQAALIKFETVAKQGGGNTWSAFDVQSG